MAMYNYISLLKKYKTPSRKREELINIYTDYGNQYYFNMYYKNDEKKSYENANYISMTSNEDDLLKSNKLINIILLKMNYKHNHIDTWFDYFLYPYHRYKMESKLIKDKMKIIEHHEILTSQILEYNYEKLCSDKL